MPDGGTKNFGVPRKKPCQSFVFIIFCVLLFLMSETMGVSPFFSLSIHYGDRILFQASFSSLA